MSMFPRSWKPSIQRVSKLKWEAWYCDGTLPVIEFQRNHDTVNILVVRAFQRIWTWCFDKPALGVDSPARLGWCEHCGEGVTDFCRGKSSLCQKGLRVLKQPKDDAGVREDGK